MAHHMGNHTEFSAICTNFGEGSVKLQENIHIERDSS